MSDTLNARAGRCIGTASLSIRPVQAVIELGATADVISKALNAIHHANRHGDVQDFLAVALSDMKKERDHMITGHDIEVFGSTASLSSLLNLDGLQLLQRRGMIRDAEIKEVHVDVGETGSAWVRDRKREKKTEGWERRARARAERNGHTFKERKKGHPYEQDLLMIMYGTTPIHLRKVDGEMSDTPLMVSTYGFSSPQSPAILPF